MPKNWDTLAEIRKQQIESGKDLTFSKVFLPYYLDFIKESAPKSLLEIGCGTGHLSSALCVHVGKSIAIEPSSGMYSVAKKVLVKSNVELLCLRVEEYFTQNTFDLIISHMCLQLVDNLKEFVSSVKRLMHKKTNFVFTIPHPCFFNDYKHFFIPSEYAYMKEVTKMVSFSITKDPKTKISGVPYCHRPLTKYFSVLKECGLCIVSFEETFPVIETQMLYGKKWEFPRYCVFHVQRRS